MEFYVKVFDPNKNQIVDFNIFSNISFTRSVQIANGQSFKSYEDYKEKIRQELLYTYRMRREYELAVGDAFSKDTRKMDVYEQCAPNLDIIAQIAVKMPPIYE